MSAPDWTERVTPFLNSRHFGLQIVLILTILGNGLAIFMLADIAKYTLFWSNNWIWFTLVHSGLMLSLSLLMAVRLWQWRMEQLGVMCALGAICILNFLLCSYIGIATYSAAPIGVKLVLWIILLSYHGWFAFRVAIAFRTAWGDSSLRNLMLVEKADHFIFLQKGEILVREKVGLQIHSSSLSIIIFLIAGFATYFVRKSLVDYFDVSWVPIAYAVITFPLATLGTSLFMVGWQYFFYPNLLTRQTGKVVYLDNMSRPLSKA